MSKDKYVDRLIKIFKSKDDFESSDLDEIQTISKKNLASLTNFLFIFTKSSFQSITFSKNIFIPVTYLCRNNCSYCGFRKEISELDKLIMKISEIKNFLKKAKDFDCKEVLLTFGEKPEEKYPEILDELVRMGYQSLHEYHVELCNIIIEYGLLPHSNPGLLTFGELVNLKKVNASMGLMLESSSERLCIKGGPHEKSPSKLPKKRLEMIQNAGKLRIPFTTGILIGIGETFSERIDSLMKIKKIHEKYGHVQEIIIQNFLPKIGTKMENVKPVSIDEIIKTIVVARLIFRDKMSIQVPPNLTFYDIDEILTSGINDLGGISPITLDEINPEMKWPTENNLKQTCQKYGLKLEERLPVYPQYINSEFLSEKILKNITSFLNQ